MLHAAPAQLWRCMQRARQATVAPGASAGAACGARRSKVDSLLQQALQRACQAKVALGASAGDACVVRHSKATSLLQQALHAVGVCGLETAKSESGGHQSLSLGERNVHARFCDRTVWRMV